MALYEVPVDVKPLRRNRALGHKIVMSMLPSNVFDSTAPRGDAQALWWLDEDNESLLVSTQTPLVRGQYTELPQQELPKKGDRVEFDVDMTLMYSPVATVPQELWDAGYRPKRGRRVMVPAERREEVATQRLEKHGVTVHSLTVGNPVPFPLHTKGRDSHLSALPVNVTATVTDPEAFHQAMTQGIGRLRNYGAGLIRLVA